MPAATSWFDREPRLGPVGRGLLGRLMARGRYSWPVWVAVAVVLAGAATAWRVTHPPDYEVTVGLLVTEQAFGVSEADSEELGTGALRALVEQLAFSRPRMLSLIARHPEAFPPGGDTELALDNLRSRIDVEIKQNEFMEWHERDDPPRSVQVAISYRDRAPEAAFAIANELGKLVVDTGRARTQEVRGRERAAAGAALSQAGGRLEAEEAAGRGALRPPKTALGAQQRLREVARQATDAALAAAGGGEQTLRFELVDTGRLPRRFTSATALLRGAVILAVLGMAGWLLAGAFDPRVLLAGDIALAGLAVLGALPSLPVAPPRAGQPGRSAGQDTGDDREPSARPQNPGRG